jgi:hypothetical protein
MKKSIGGLLLAIAALFLLLMTCDGPGLWIEPGGASSGGEAPVSPQAEAPPELLAGANPAPAGALGEAPAATGEDAGPSAPNPSVPNASAAKTAASSITPAPPSFTWPRPAPQSIASPVTPRAAQPVSVQGMEALLAMSPRALEGGTDAPVLFVSVDSLRHQLRIPLTVDRNWLPTDYTRGQPSSTINTPTAYGQRWGDLYAGVGYQDRIRYDDWSDGVAAMGLGLGNPSRYVGLDVALSLLDTYTEFGKDRSLSVKLHRQLPYRTAIAVGHENLWHTDGTDGGSSRYVVVSKVLLFRDRPTAPLGSMVVNLGLGNDRFLPETQFARGADGVNAFGSVGVRLVRPVNAVANWTGQDLALGLSIAPVRTWPLVITPAVMDVTGRAGDGARFSVSAGLSYNFRR